MPNIRIHWGKFEGIKTEIIDKEDLRNFCHDCGSEIEMKKSIRHG